MISTEKFLKILSATPEQRDKMIDKLSVEDLRLLVKLMFQQMKGEERA